MSNQIKIVGTIHHIGQTQIVSDKFQKREFVIQTDDKYPQFISMQTTNDKCSLLDNLKFGDAVECMINLRGREWIDPKTSAKRYFNTIECWSMSFASQSFAERTQQQMVTKSEPTQTPVQNQKPSTPDPLDQLVGDGDDDLPF